MLPALTLDGIIYCHITVGSFKGPLFLEFMNELLEEMNPYPGPNSVIVMDNCSVHRVPGIREMIEGRCVKFTRDLYESPMTCCSGMRLEYLPAYSPDFNPIENAFSSIKAQIRTSPREAQFLLDKRKDSIPEAKRLLYEYVWTVTPQKARGWFKHCGYID